MNLFLPATTWLFFKPEATQEEMDQEVEQLVQRQKAISDWLHGDNDTDLNYVMDLLAEQRIDPIEWAETTVDNIEVVYPGLL